MKVKVFLLFLFYISSFSEIFINEEFESMKNWEELIFPKIDKKTEYKIVKDEDNFYLKTESNGSASAIIYKDSFDVYKYNKIKWRWKTENIYEKGDVRTKKGDDYPIRIYIVFEYDSKNSSFMEKTRYNFAKKIYGKYPPDSSLNYIWASTMKKDSFASSPYTKRSKILALRSGVYGEWFEESRDIIKDYIKIFKKYPPKRASIAIMSDSDNTGEAVKAYIDFIKISSR